MIIFEIMAAKNLLNGWEEIIFARRPTWGVCGTFHGSLVTKL
jgi:hypothetical protein